MTLNSLSHLRQLMSALGESSTGTGPLNNGIPLPSEDMTKRIRVQRVGGVYSKMMVEDKGLFAGLVAVLITQHKPTIASSADTDRSY
jgi:hypothetical protein